MGGHFVTLAAFAAHKVVGGVEPPLSKGMGVDFTGGVGFFFLAAAGGQQKYQQKAQEGEALFHSRYLTF